MTARERFEDALRERGLAVKGSRAQCPAHEDRKPSVSINDRRDGKGIVVKCHAGCETLDVMAAVDMTLRDTFDDDQMRNAYSDNTTYIYPGGRRVHRKSNKDFPQSGNKQDRSLFRADLIGDAETVYVPEGEKDVLAIEAVGGVAVCSAMGAGKADRFDWSPLRGKNAIIVADKDEPGRDHARDIAKLLDGIAASVRIVEAAVGKDAADHIAAGLALGELVDQDEHDDDRQVQAVPWPTLDPKALHGTAGEIVNAIDPHTEADPPALLVQLMAEFGATLGPADQPHAESGFGPHIVVGNDRHAPIINPLIVGKTSNGAKGTSLGCVNAVMRAALPEFAAMNVASGLSSSEGLIERVRDPHGDPDDNDYDPGVWDKRLLVQEAEYRHVLSVCRREGNNLATTLRDLFDGKRQLQTMTRGKNRLIATGAHVVVIGHVTPREFRNELSDSDFSGGSINRLAIVLSKRSKRLSRLGNIPADVLAAAAEKFKEAHDKARTVGKMNFSTDFWAEWDAVYPDLTKDRPESRAAEATARGVVMVLRFSMLYALMGGADTITGGHLRAALALWAYVEHSARWLFSTFEQNEADREAQDLARYILAGGDPGRSRTEISTGFFKRHATAQQIDARLAPLIQDGTIVQIPSKLANGRTVFRYCHRTVSPDSGRRKCESAKNAGQDIDSPAKDLRTIAKTPPDPGHDDGHNSHNFGLL